MSTFYSDQEGMGVCQFSNNSIFVCGQRGGFPFIAKLQNNPSLTPYGCYWVNGTTSGSSFNKIIKATSNLVCMGSIGLGTGYSDFICKIDSNVNLSVGPAYVFNQFNSINPNCIYQVGSQTMVSFAITGSTGLAFFDNNLVCQYGNSYGISNPYPINLLFHNNQTYLTGLAGFIEFVKGSSSGYYIFHFIVFVRL